MLFAVMFAALLPQLARADVPVAKNDDGQLNVGAMIQTLGFGQQVNDPYRNDARAYLFIKEARLRSSGNYGDFTFSGSPTPATRSSSSGRSTTWASASAATSAPP